jgi:hypothetical protein
MVLFLATLSRGEILKDGVPYSPYGTSGGGLGFVSKGLKSDHIYGGAGGKKLWFGGIDAVYSNASPNAAGYNAVTNLRAKGWTVTVN